MAFEIFPVPLSFLINSSPPLTSEFMKFGERPKTPSATMSVRFEALVTSRNLVAEALTDPLEVRLTKSVERFPLTLPIP